MIGTHLKYSDSRSNSGGNNISNGFNGDHMIDNALDFDLNTRSSRDGTDITAKDTAIGNTVSQSIHLMKGVVGYSHPVTLGHIVMEIVCVSIHG